MAKSAVELSRIVTDKKDVDDLYGQLDRLRREIGRILASLDRRIQAVEEK